MMTEFLGELCL